MALEIEPGEKVVIAALVSAKDKSAAAHINRFSKLLESVGAPIVGTLVQRRGVSRAPKPGGAHSLTAPMSPATLIGAGKVKELVELTATSDATTVAFLNELKSAQVSRLQEATGCRVVSAGGIVERN